jgi:hypothetical protein
MHSHQDQYFRPAQLGYPPTNDQAGQANGTRATRRSAEKADHGARPTEREGGAGAQAHWMEELSMSMTRARSIMGEMETEVRSLRSV